MEITNIYYMNLRETPNTHTKIIIIESLLFEDSEHNLLTRLDHVWE